MHLFGIEIIIFSLFCFYKSWLIWKAFHRETGNFFFLAAAQQRQLPFGVQRLAIGGCGAGGDSGRPLDQSNAGVDERPRPPLRPRPRGRCRYFATLAAPLPPRRRCRLSRNQGSASHRVFPLFHWVFQGSWGYDLRAKTENRDTRCKPGIVLSISHPVDVDVVHHFVAPLPSVSTTGFGRTTGGEGVLRVSGAAVAGGPSVRVASLEPRRSRRGRRGRPNTHCLGNVERFVGKVFFFKRLFYFLTLLLTLWNGICLLIHALNSWLMHKNAASAISQLFPLKSSFLRLAPRASCWDYTKKSALKREKKGEHFPIFTFCKGLNRPLGSTVVHTSQVLHLLFDEHPENDGQPTKQRHRYDRKPAKPSETQ